MSKPKSFVDLFKFGKPREVPTTHVIWKNVPPSSEYLHAKNLKVTNRVKTSRYEIWNFVPMCLMEQFRKISNVYFVILIIVLLILGKKSPVSPVTTILPLVFVILVAMAKQAYEDYNRHKSDNFVNGKLIHTLKSNDFVPITSDLIKMGDVIMIQNDEEFPCDLVLLASSNPLRTCYITTVNFDGETNLKLRYCVGATAGFVQNAQFGDLRCVIECDLPNHDLYKFNGKLTIDSERAVPTPLNPENFLLRGAKLRNTEYVIGVAVYIGQQTKMALNQQKKRRKFSIVEKKLNQFIILMIFILSVGSTLVTLMHYFVSNDKALWYIDQSHIKTFASDMIIDIAGFFGLLNHLIPISLSVTIEIQKFWNSFFIDWDLEMYHLKSDESARSNSSDTIEELGQIEHVFTDKTGTLTENLMIFRKCAIGNSVFTKKGNFLNDGANHDAKNMSQEMLAFWTYVAICHSAEAIVKPRSPGEGVAMYKYMSPSPDEVALLEAAASFGIVYRGKELDVLTIEINATQRRIRVKNILEFDSTRKRMSVVFQDENDEMYLVCKGADSHVVPKAENFEIRDKVNHHVTSFASDGLRTLVFAYKKLSMVEYEKTAEILRIAELNIVERESALQEAYENIENGLTLIGATAVDDRLQEGVYDTLNDLRVAGIKIWVLTGDKEETAISVSYKCGHLSSKMKILYLCERIENLETVLMEYDAFLSSKSEREEMALIIDGVSLKNLLKEYKEQLYRIFGGCSAILCCRMSPLQKSKIVNFIRKSGSREPITLAIGDGANDCSMIQEAHVGVGVIGKEGRQAVYCSDFAIYRFRYLKKLLLYHGYNFYNRIAYTVLYFFYKNFIFCFPMFLYVWYTNYSPSPLFMDAEITMYNTLVTSLPVIIFGVFEQSYKKGTLMTKPKIYQSISRNKVLSWWMMFFWLFNAFWQGMTIFYWCMMIYNDGMINIPYHYFTYTLFGTMVYTYVVICVTLQIQLLTKFWTLHSVVCTVGSIFYFVICETFISLIYTFNSTSPVFASKFSSYYVFFNMLSFPHFWCGLLIVIPIAFFPYFVMVFVSQVVQKHFHI